MSIKTKNTPPYYEANEGTVKIYSALITQLGTDDPTVIVLNNTIGDIVWTRTAIGNYQGELIGAFPAEKTYLIAPSTDQATTTTSIGEQIFPDSVLIRVRNGGAYQDGYLWKSAFEIRVYP